MRPDLSLRTAWIVALTAAGLTTDEIARLLHVSRSVVTWYLSLARLRAGARNSCHLVWLTYGGWR